MINPNTSVLLRHRLPNFSSPIQEIYACSSCGKYIILDDDDNEVSFNRSDFLIHYPHINTLVRVTDTDSHFFPLGTIAKITDIEFWEDEGQEYTNHHYFYLCSYSGHKQYLLRSQFKLIR